jgi:hypothetical protein
MDFKSDLCLWKIILFSIRKVIKSEDKISEIQYNIGDDLISNNELLYRELYSWIDIYNNYIQKLPFFYQFIHSKDYQSTIKELTKSIENLKQKVNSPRIRNDEKTYSHQLKQAILKHHKNNYDYVFICKILNYIYYTVNALENSFFINTHTLDPIENIDIINSYDINILVEDITERSLFQPIRLTLEKENNKNSLKIDELKDKLDKLTDIIESPDLLSIDKIKEFNLYIDKHSNYLSNLIAK